jgi:hypothetical protein
MTIEKRQGEVVFNFTTFSSRMATKKNEDGSTSFICTDPVMAYFPIVVGGDSGKRTLIVRDGRHEYKFVEAK